MTGPDRSAADLLRTAAGLISEKGHAKRVVEASDGAVCALGALSSAATGTAGELPLSGVHAYYKAHSVLSRYALTEFGFQTVPSWNNDPRTSAEDVILAMKTVAEQLDDQS